jgi:hypothetical protein
VKLTDTYDTVSTSQKATDSIGASAWALQKAYDTLNSNKQGTITAGTGLSKSGNTLSVMGGTYQRFLSPLYISLSLDSQLTIDAYSIKSTTLHSSAQSNYYTGFYDYNQFIVISGHGRLKINGIFYILDDISQNSNIKKFAATCSFANITSSSKTVTGNILVTLLYQK